MAASATRHVTSGLTLCLLAYGVLAQQGPRVNAKRQVKESPGALGGINHVRLITADEGLAILGAALEVRYRAHAGRDCSHLVHQIYEQAGFSYRYADSIQLYNGIESFRQVNHPQAGDLAVWRGHAAIVVNPAQHSFFSSTGSGLRVESYDLKYWKRRGPPRFFRYLAPEGSYSATTAAISNPPVLREVNSREATTDSPVVTSADSDGVAHDDRAPSPVTHGSPPVLMVHSAKPNSKQVADTLTRTFGENGKSFEGGDLMHSSQPLVVFDHLQVAKVRLTGNRGWADVRIEGMSTITSGRATAKKRLEQRWTLLRRDAHTWEILPTLQTTYLPSALAVTKLAHRLALLLDGTPAAGDSKREQQQLAHTLTVLLAK